MGRRWKRHMQLPGSTLLLLTDPAFAADGGKAGAGAAILEHEEERLRTRQRRLRGSKGHLRRPAVLETSNSCLGSTSTRERLQLPSPWSQLCTTFHIIHISEINLPRPNIHLLPARHQAGADRERPHQPGSLTDQRRLGGEHLGGRPRQVGATEEEL